MQQTYMYNNNYYIHQNQEDEQRYAFDAHNWLQHISTSITDRKKPAQNRNYFQLFAISPLFTTLVDKNTGSKTCM